VIEFRVAHLPAALSTHPVETTLESLFCAFDALAHLWPASDGLAPTSGRRDPRGLLVTLLFVVVVALSWLPFVAMGYNPLDSLFEWFRRRERRGFPWV